MRFLMLLFLVLLAGVCLTMAQGSYEDCCLKYDRGLYKIKRRIIYYRRQEADGGCNIPAIIFKTKKKTFCANPKELWVPHVITRIDKHSQKHAFPLKRA